MGDCECVLYLSCPLDVLQARLLERGRADDTAELIEKRNMTFEQNIIPVVEYYRSINKVHEVHLFVFTY